MEDTPREIRELVTQIVMARSEEERFLICAEMHEAGKEFARLEMPEGLTSREQRLYIFRKLFGVDPDFLVRQCHD